MARDLSKLTSREMTPAEWRRFRREWMAARAAGYREEAGASKATAALWAETDFEAWIGAAGDEARDERILHERGGE